MHDGKLPDSATVTAYSRRSLVLTSCILLPDDANETKILKQVRRRGGEGQRRRKMRRRDSKTEGQSVVELLSRI